MASNGTILVYGGFAALAIYILGKRDENKTESVKDADISDVNALARMLESETSNQHAREIIGYIVTQVAKRRGVSIYQLLTQGKGWGPQDRRKSGDGIMYASTRKAAQERTKELAKDIIDGNFGVPAIVRNNIGAWYEKLPSVTDKMLIDRQKSWKEGIYAKIRGTNWYLYSRNAPYVDSLDEVKTLV